MTKIATSVSEQINILKTRGLIITDEDKARENLLDIGYYRLGFYLFPLEKTYPSLKKRRHDFIEGATFDDAVWLYYFDFDLRMLLVRYLSRIEVNFRTLMIYHMSNIHNSNAVWFVDPAVVSRTYIQDFEREVYNAKFKKKDIIKRHHQKSPNDRFAPAWKTLEFMTFGSVLKLYEELKAYGDKLLIAEKMGFNQPDTFCSYMHTIRELRNACVHGSLLYDIRLPKRIKRGPAALKGCEYSNIIGALKVTQYVMSVVSVKRAEEMVDKIHECYKVLCKKSPLLSTIIPNFYDVKHKMAQCEP